VPVVFPVHPRTRPMLKGVGLEKADREKRVFICQPMSYLDFLKHMSCAKLVITDSGGVQEETTILGIPCITVRKNTERPVTVVKGTNVLVSADATQIEKLAGVALRGEWKKGSTPELWDGKTGQRIVELLIEALSDV